MRRGESSRVEPYPRGESYPLAGENPFFEGPDMGDPEIRATMGMLTSMFKIQPFNPDGEEFALRGFSLITEFIIQCPTFWISFLYCLRLNFPPLEEFPLREKYTSHSPELTF